MASTLDPSITANPTATLNSPAPENSRPDSFEAPVHDALTASHALVEARTHELDEAPASGRVDTCDGEARDSDAAFQPHILGISKDDAWITIRRFNLLVFRVKATKKWPLSDFDMRSTEQGQTSPEQLQAQLARLYMSVIIGLFAFYKHMARLRSWSEPQRTSKFLSVYFVAWLVNLLAPTFFLFLMMMILSPASRPLFFPPIPPSIVDARTGGVQKPPAGVMASESSITGAPENHKGEAIEQEAHSFITSFSKVRSKPQLSLMEERSN